MATAVHTSSTPYPPPPSYSQNSTDSSVNGLQPPHSTMNSFDAPQSSNTTPTPTPPTSRHQNPLPYPNTSFSALNGMHNSFQTPRHPSETKPSGPPQYNAGHKPQIYTAVYSGVSVYEMELDNLAVMRRRSDSWMNATQILKLAGIDKGKRTKVLEKEILSGEHEKVQGGYGKYQGTWISYNRAIEFAKGYGVLEPLRPLLEYDMGQEGHQAGAGNLNTPTKEQAMAAQRKRNMMNGGLDRGPAPSPNGTFFKNISKSAANAVNAINKARFDSPAPRPGSQGAFRRPSQQMDSQDTAYANSSQQSMRSLHSEPSFGNSQLDPALRELDGPYLNSASNVPNEEPPRKRMKASFARDTKSYDGLDTSMTDAPENDGYLHPASQANLDYTIAGLPPLKRPDSARNEKKLEMVASLFMDPHRKDFSDHPAILNLSGEDLDIPIDAKAHTALHWAATLAKTSLARDLVRKGANIYRVNVIGETPLIRASQTTNNLDHGNFPQLLELLGPTIEVRDGKGRTVLHHIAVCSAIKGAKWSPASRYYLESLLEYVVRSGSATNSQANSFADPATTPNPRPIGLAKFMSDVVNAPDMVGDTALNLAAKHNNKNIIQQLLEVGADSTIRNSTGLRPMDFGVAGDINVESETKGSFTKTPDAPHSRVAETSSELITSLKCLIQTTETSFNAQMQSKQSLIDASQSRLKETTSLLNQERERLRVLQQAADKRKAMQQRILNLRAANARHRANLGANAKPDVSVGDADAGLEIDTSIIPFSFQEVPGPLKLRPDQKAYLATKPTAAVLKARSEAYKKVNERLEHQARMLRSQSSEVENMLRKLIAISTDVSEEEVDERVRGLVKAVEKEDLGDVETERVREFLRRVEGEKMAAS